MKRRKRYSSLWNVKFVFSPSLVKWIHREVMVWYRFTARCITTSDKMDQFYLTKYPDIRSIFSQWFLPFQMQNYIYISISTDAILIFWCIPAYSRLRLFSSFNLTSFGSFVPKIYRKRMKDRERSATNKSGFILCNQTSRSYLYGSILLVFL